MVLSWCWSAPLPLGDPVASDAGGVSTNDPSEDGRDNDDCDACCCGADDSEGIPVRSAPSIVNVGIALVCVAC